ncbi:hypothetical protein AB0L33_21065 [Streptomyces sp. NPDC052299]|uniref:hypothetical protein n=1 Tax=Streptomyces sp. NPDC052299 TaxID=3155054 RepID=UPI0034310B2E
MNRRIWRRRPSAPAPTATAPAAPHTVVEEFGTETGAGGAAGFLLRSSADRRTSVRDLARRLPVDRDRPVIVVDVPADAAGNLGEELGGLLARLRDEHRTAARLVMSGAAAPKPDGLLPLAQRLADAWDLEIEAPDAAAVLVPGGGLYVAEPTTPAGGWWRFAPGSEPVALGARLPAPHWQRALARVPLGDLGGCAAHRIPAGLLLSPAGAAAPGPGHAAYALAVHPERMTVLVGGARPDAAEDLAALLARLPARLRDRARLAPAGGDDLLPAARRTADLLGAEVEVCTGVPLPSADAHRERIWLTAPDGTSAWPALLASVRCGPAGTDGPRPVHWLLPATVGEPGSEPAVRRLGEGCYAVAVRAGLWVGISSAPPHAVLERPAEARAARIEIGDADTDDAERDTLLDALAALLPELDEEVREHAEVSAPADADRETVATLRRFAIRHGLAFTASAAPVPERPAPAPDLEAAPDPEPATGPDSTPGSASTPAASPTPATGPESTPTREAALTPEGAGPETPPLSLPEPTTESGTTPPPGPAPTGPEPGTPPPPTAAPTAATVPPPIRAARPATSSRSSTESALGPAPEAAPPVPAAPVARAEVRTAEAGPPPAAATTPRPPRLAAPARAATGFSSDADRAAFRELAAAVWADYTGPVNRTMVRLPALRGPAEEQARVDLVAVHLYLASPPDGRFGALALAAEAGYTEGELAPYAACLASGLRRLPALRGTLMRAVPGPGIADEAVVGAVLRCDAPLDVVHLEQKGAPSPPQDHVRYVIRPMTARRTSMLADPGDAGVRALFAAGTEFTVLAAHAAAGERPARVLLAEVPEGTAQFRQPPPDVVARLDEAAGPVDSTSGAGWPARCTGPLPRRA